MDPHAAIQILEAYAWRSAQQSEILDDAAMEVAMGYDAKRRRCAEDEASNARAAVDAAIFDRAVIAEDGVVRAPAAATAPTQQQTSNSPLAAASATSARYDRRDVAAFIAHCRVEAETTEAALRGRLQQLLLQNEALSAHVARIEEEKGQELHVTGGDAVTAVESAPLREDQQHRAHAEYVDHLERVVRFNDAVLLRAGWTGPTTVDAPGL
jgi:hypothetical protein